MLAIEPVEVGVPDDPREPAAAAKLRQADNARPYSYTIKRPVFFKTGRCFYGEALENFRKGKGIFQIFLV